jgi:hypothetical protein
VLVGHEIQPVVPNKSYLALQLVQTVAEEHDAQLAGQATQVFAEGIYPLLHAEQVVPLHEVQFEGHAVQVPTLLAVVM